MALVISATASGWVPLGQDFFFYFLFVHCITSESELLDYRCIRWMNSLCPWFFFHFRKCSIKSKGSWIKMAKNTHTYTQIYLYIYKYRLNVTTFFLGWTRATWQHTWITMRKMKKEKNKLRKPIYEFWEINC